MRTTAILSTLLLSAGLLTGCGGGGSSSDAYCDDLKAAKAQFDALDSGTPDFNELDKAFKTFHGLADDAPSEVADEWKTLDGAITDLEKGLEDVGLTVKDLGSITSGQIPEGMTQEDLTKALPKLQTAFKSLDDDKVQKAADEIEKHAKSECNIKLGS